MSTRLDWAGEYEVEVVSARTEERHRLKGWKSLQWGRVRNGISEASITLPNFDGPRRARRARTMRALEPWAMEMIVHRNGTKVWCGPVLGWSNDDAQAVTIRAFDYMRVTRRRHIATTASYTNTPVGTVLNRVINDAFALPGSTYAFTAAAAGWATTTTQQFSASSLEKLWDVIERLSEIGVSWTMVGPDLIASAAELTAISEQVGVFTDQAFATTPKIDVTGEEQATLWYVGGGDSTETGWSAFGQSSQPIDAALGRLESSEVRDDILNPTEANTLATAQVDRFRFPLLDITEVPLTPNAPVTVAHLIPGINVRVSLEETSMLGALDAVGSVAVGLESVAVEAVATDNGLSEVVKVKFGPASPEVG